jgi:hypothetical protein
MEMRRHGKKIPHIEKLKAELAEYQKEQAPEPQNSCTHNHLSFGPNGYGKKTSR